jgi:hypothetical protein
LRANDEIAVSTQDWGHGASGDLHRGCEREDKGGKSTSEPWFFDDHFEIRLWAYKLPDS